MHYFPASILIVVAFIGKILADNSCEDGGLPSTIRIGQNGILELVCTKTNCFDRENAQFNYSNCDEQWTSSSCSAPDQYNRRLFIQNYGNDSKSVYAQCCEERLVEKLAFSVNTVTMGFGTEYIGGDQYRAGRLASFKLIKDVRMFGADSLRPQMAITIYQLSCVGDPEAPANSAMSDTAILSADLPGGRQAIIRQLNDRTALAQQQPLGGGDSNALVPLSPLAIGARPSASRQPLGGFFSGLFGGARPRAFGAASSGPIAPVQQGSYAAPQQQQETTYIVESAPAYEASSGQQSYYSSCCNSQGCDECGMMCFSGEQTVRTPAGIKKMRDLAVGDLLLTQEGESTTYSPVVMFLHRLPGQLADFHRIQTESGQTIELTGDHLIYVTDCKLNNAIDMQIIPAKNVKVGDCLRTTAENSNGVELRTSRVVNITMVQSSGIYAPLTESSQLIVSDVLASCHSSVDRGHLQTTVFRMLRLFHDLMVNSFGMSIISNRDLPTGVETVTAILHELMPFQSA